MSAVEYRELQDEYRIALRFWSDTRALYPENSLEVIEMEERLEELEYLLGHTEPPVFKYTPVRAMGF